MSSFYFKTSLILLVMYWYFSTALKAQNAIILHSNTEISILDNSLTRTKSFIIQINNKEGEECCDVSIYSSKLVKISRISASIEDISGTIVKKLRSSDIKKHSASANFSFYDDNMVQEFSLRHNVYPYLLKYSYQENEEQFMYIDYWTPVLNNDFPTREAILQLTFPLNYKVNHTFSTPDSFKKDTVAGLARCIWKYSFSNPLPSPENYSADIDTRFPYVKIVPLQFTYENKGSMESWETLGNWKYSLTENRQELTAPEKIKIPELIRNQKDTTEIVKSIYHYLQDNTRYINVSEKTGGMVPHPASYVCTNKFGDCKALSNYMISMLKYVGIRAVYCSINAGEKIRPVDRSFPSQQSNHVIVCVPLKNDSLWLDCTSRFPFNYPGTFTQGRDVLLCEKENSRYTQTPVLKPSDVKCSRTIIVKPNDENEASLDVQAIFRGEDFEEIISMDLQNKNDKDIYLRNKLSTQGEEINSYEIIKENRDSAFVTLHYKANSKTVFVRYGNDMVLKTVSIQLPRFGKPSSRKYDVQIDYPLYLTDTQYYHFGDWFTVDQLPANMSTKSQYGEYHCDFSVKDGILEVRKSFLLYSGLILLRDYPAFYGFISEANEKEKSSCVSIISKK